MLLICSGLRVCFSVNLLSQNIREGTRGNDVLYRIHQDRLNREGRFPILEDDEHEMSNIKDEPLPLKLEFSRQVTGGYA